jgi:hypothetical protein
MVSIETETLFTVISFSSCSLARHLLLCILLENPVHKFPMWTGRAWRGWGGAPAALEASGPWGYSFRLLRPILFGSAGPHPGEGNTASPSVLMAPLSRIPHQPPAQGSWVHFHHPHLPPCQAGGGSLGTEPRPPAEVQMDGSRSLCGSQCLWTLARPQKGSPAGCAGASTPRLIWLPSSTLPSVHRSGVDLQKGLELWCGLASVGSFFPLALALDWPHS